MASLSAACEAPRACDPGNRHGISAHRRFVCRSQLVSRHMLRSGEGDIIMDVNRGMITHLRDQPGIAIVTAPPGAVMMLYRAYVAGLRSIRLAIAPFGAPSLTPSIVKRVQGFQPDPSLLSQRWDVVRLTP